MAAGQATLPGMLLLTLLLACTSDDPAPADGPPDTPPTDSVVTPTGTSTTPTGTSPTGDTGPTTPPQDAREALTRRGYVVQDGALVFSTMEGCCDPMANCWGNNPSTPYGTYALPPGPGRPIRDDALLDDFGPVPKGLSRDFLLRPDEAIVWVGTLPPTAKYIGLRTYLGKRPGENRAIIGSLGPSLNQMVLGEQRGSSAIWGEPVAVVTSADAAVEREVTEALIAGGWDPDHIAVDRLPPEVVNLGDDAALHDTLFGIVRVAVYEDVAAGEAWEANPGELWRVTPQIERSVSEPHPIPELLERGAGTDEDAWVDAALALGEAVIEKHGPDGYLREVRPYWRETLECIDSTQSCTGDLRDRHAAVTWPFRLPTEGSYLVSFGVNHERTGKASYSSVSVQTIASQRGISSFASDKMPRSASNYLDHPLVDDLYVVIFARTCEGFEAPCIEVPWDCPGGPSTEDFKITARAYLEPATGTAPLPEEMLKDLVYLVVPDAGPGTPTGSTGSTGSTGDTGGGGITAPFCAP